MGAQPATTYPTHDQYQRWKNEAEKRDMSVSEFIAYMVEAGLKKFEASATPDESHEQLRRQRNDLKEELDRARERIQDLEEQLYRTERRAMREFVEDNPGTDFESIVNHVESTASVRTLFHIEEMEGESVRVEDDQYYPVEA